MKRETARLARIGDRQTLAAPWRQACSWLYDDFSAVDMLRDPPLKQRNSPR